MLAALLLSLLALPGSPGSTLSGWLVDPDGVRIEGAVLILEPLDGQADGPRTVGATSDTGRFCSDGLKTGRWRPVLQHWGPGLGDVRFDPPELCVPSPPVRLEVAVAHLTANVPSESNVFCMQVPDVGDPGGLQGGVVIHPGLRMRSLLLRRGARGVVGAWSSRRGLVERSFELPEEGPWGQRIQLPELPAETARGRVEVRVPRLQTSAQIGVSVLAPRSRFELSRHMIGWLDPRGWRFDLSLPPGEYLLQVGDSEFRGGCGVDSGWDRHVARPIEVPITVTSGSHQALDLRWSESVRPVLAFDAPGASEIFVWEFDAWGLPTRSVDWEPLTANGARRPCQGWTPGVPHPTREPLPVGRVRLLAGAEGFAPLEFELDLVEGVSCAARVALSALEGEAQELAGERAERTR